MRAADRNFLYGRYRGSYCRLSKAQEGCVYNQLRSYCPANSVQTFFEVKHMGPFPELLFSFTGLVVNFFVAAGRVKGVKHIAPSLLISGNPNLHTKTISAFVAAQYHANVLAHLFVRPSFIYSANYKISRGFASLKLIWLDTQTVANKISLRHIQWTST